MRPKSRAWSGDMKLSRSFAAVIRQLPYAMAIDVLLFYIVLRALDTIEDDMEAFKGDEASKCKHLRAFGDDYLGNESWRLEGVGGIVGRGSVGCAVGTADGIK